MWLKDGPVELLELAVSHAAITLTLRYAAVCVSINIMDFFFLVCVSVCVRAEVFAEHQI